MRNKGLLAIAAIVAVVAVGGIGFATISSNQITVSGTATSGSIELAWSGPVSYAQGTYTSCSFTSSSPYTTAYLTVTDLSSGDSCTAYAYITDEGSFDAASVTSSLTETGGTYCNPSLGTNCIQVTDSVGINLENGYPSWTATGTPYIAAGGTVLYWINVGLPSGTYTSVSGTFTVTIEGSA